MCCTEILNNTIIDVETNSPIGQYIILSILILAIVSINIIICQQHNAIILRENQSKRPE
jgi:hypothetical protein